MKLALVETDDRVLAAAVATISLEIAGLESLRTAMQTGALAAAIGPAVTLIRNTRGRVLVTGMGKSGLVGRKIAATMASTGTPAMFLHPADASHGDLGMITSNDVVLALSWSGETAELNAIVTYCARFDVKLIAMTAGADSGLAKAADVALILPWVTEACPHHLAPTSSTTVQIALGDALAIALIEIRGFSATDFRIFHPGGKMGAQLTLVGDLMGRDVDVPRVSLRATLSEATVEMSSKRYGSTAVVDEDGRLVGAFTDGDLRRVIARSNLADPIAKLMNPSPLTIAADTLASEALAIMNGRAITTLFVCEDGVLVGALHLHDILRAGVA